MASVEKRPHVPTERMKEFLTQRGGRETEGGGGRLLACPEEGCDKVLTSYPGLRYHIRTHASQPPSYACINCQKQFKSSNGLKYHMERTRCEGSMHSVNYTTFQIPAYRGGSQGESDEPSDFSETSDGSHPGSPVKTVLSNKTDLLGLYGTETVCMDVCSNSNPSNMTISSPERSSSGGEYHDWLRELAIIATGPQSPLIMSQNAESDFVQLQGSPPLSPTALPAALHSYARPPRSRTPSPAARSKVSSPVNRSIVISAKKRHASGEGEAYVSSSSPLPSRPRSCSESWDTWSHSWPTAIWQCFIRGTHVKFLDHVRGGKLGWQAVDELAQREALSLKAAQNPKSTCYAAKGLKVNSIEEGESELDPGSVLHLIMSPGILDQSDLLAECAVDHPFFVKDKGWCSVNPGLTVEHYGIPCCELEIGDLCLPPAHPDASFNSTVFESFKSYDFTPMDTSAVFALSSMARQRRDQELSPQASPTYPPFRQRSSSKPEAGRAKRPMNAFMLFAKRFRLEYMQLHPGKDNRAISVLLGDQWRRLGSDARRAYTQEARQLAEEHRKAHPDCWKRKRSHSTSCVDPKW